VVNACWSIILVSVPDYRVVPNDLKRYNFNNHSPFKREVDRSLKISMGWKPLAGIPQSNWLPAPDGKPVSLTFRADVPFRWTQLRRYRGRAGASLPPTLTVRAL
jgi:hypothetical protein